MENDAAKAPMWKRIIAGILDFLLVFMGGGYAIASLTGNTSESGFELNGAPALVLFALVIGYFVVCNKWLGGTVFQRVFGIAAK